MGNSAKLEAVAGKLEAVARQAGSVRQAPDGAAPRPTPISVGSNGAGRTPPTMFVLLALHLVVGVAVVAAARLLGRRAFAVAAVHTAAVLVWATTQWGGVVDGEPVTETFTWVSGLTSPSTSGSTRSPCSWSPSSRGSGC